MKKEYTIPQIITYKVDQNNVICSSLILDSGSTSTMHARTYEDMDSDIWGDEE